MYLITTQDRVQVRCTGKIQLKFNNVEQLFNPPINIFPAVLEHRDKPAGFIGLA